MSRGIGVVKWAIYTERERVNQGSVEDVGEGRVGLDNRASRNLGQVKLRMGDA